MKNLIKIMMGGLLLLAACQNKQDAVAGFIPGTYVNSAKGEYAMADDTLVIAKVDEANYMVTRKTGYQAIRDGKLLPRCLKVQTFRAVWDGEKEELDEPVTGRVFRFDPDRKLLKINLAVYRKLN